MAKDSDTSGKLEKLTARLSVSEDFEKAKTFQASKDHKNAVHHYEKVLSLHDYSVNNSNNNNNGNNNNNNYTNNNQSSCLLLLSFYLFYQL